MSTLPDSPTAGSLSPGQECSCLVRVVCLCAAWCRACDAYYPVFKQVSGSFPHMRFYWLDVEDRHDLVGDLDVETFPTVAVFREAQLLHLSAILPRAGVLRRLVEHAAAAEGGLAVTEAALLPEGTDWLVRQLTQNWAALNACRVQS